MSTHCVPCSIQRVILRTGRTFRGGCGAITTDCPFAFALLTEPHAGHCTTSTFDSSQRAASSLIGPEKEQLVAGTAPCVSLPSSWYGGCCLGASKAFASPASVWGTLSCPVVSDRGISTVGPAPSM